VPCEDAIHVEGTVVEVRGVGLLLVSLVNGHQLLGHVAQRDQDEGFANGFKPGQSVRLEMSPFDMSRGRVLVR